MMLGTTQVTLHMLEGMIPGTRIDMRLSSYKASAWSSEF